MGGSLCRQRRGVQRKPLSALDVFQVPSIQNNPTPKSLGGYILLPFIYIIILLDGAEKLIKDANYASRLETAKMKKLYCTKL